MRGGWTCICVSFVCLLCSWDAQHVFCWCRSGGVVLSFKPLRLVVSWESLSSSRSSACLCPQSHSLTSLNWALCVGESVRATFLILWSSGGWRQHYINDFVFSVQTWPLLKVSASLMWLTHPPLFTGGLQEFGWIAIRSHMYPLMEVSICV